MILRLFIFLALAAAAFGQTPKENLQRLVGTNTVNGSLVSTPFQVATVAALKAVVVTNIADGSQLYLTGYSSVGDGGQGYFQYALASAVADNGGTVIQPTVGSGRWLRIVDGVISVDWFGAVGDGSTDDATAVTAAVAAAAAGEVVTFSAGKTYKTTSLITITTDDITLMGYGATVSTDADTNFRKFQFSSVAGGAVYGLTFNGLYTVAATGIGAASVEVVSSTDITIRDCTFDDVAESGVYVVGESERVTITHCKFSNNFCAIFSDDDTVTQPISLTITDNDIRDGISSVTQASFSGAIKISGVGTVNSTAGHVIANNRISLPGEMGIELQTWVNDASITGNTIYGAEFGISLSGVARGTITGNVIKGCTLVGIEVASGSIHTSITGNTVDGRTTAGTSVTDYGISAVSSSEKVSITGGYLGYCSSSAILLQDLTFATISGVVIDLTATAVTVHNSSSVTISAVQFIAISGASYFVFIDSSDTTVERVEIIGCNFSGAIASNGILLYHPANVIQDVLIAENQIDGASAGGFLNYSGAGSHQRIWTRNNLGAGNSDGQTNSPFYYTSAVAVDLDHNVPVVAVDATSGVLIATLDSAVGMGLKRYTVFKKDVSGNAVTVATTSSQTISGNNAAGTYVSATTYALATQGDRITVVSDGANWIIIESR